MGHWGVNKGSGQFEFAGFRSGWVVTGCGDGYTDVYIPNSPKAMDPVLNRLA